MVRAILEGRKTQTRRVIKPVRDDDGFVLLDYGQGPWPHRSSDGETPMHVVKRGGKLYLDETPHTCPYGQPGDRLFVRETWRHIEGGAVYDAAGGIMDSHDPETIYRASRPNYPGPWKPSIYMPRWASRILLEVVSVSVERLNDISPADCVCEGYYSPPGTRYAEEELNALDWYRELWESINGPGSWAVNPWVWVVEFKRVQP